MKISLLIHSHPLLALWLIFFSTGSYGQETMGHPIIKPMPKAELVESLSEQVDFATYAFRTDQATGMELVEKKGRHWKLVYVIKNELGKTDQQVSRTEILENIKAAAKEIGGEILYERRNGKMTFTLPMENGSTILAYVTARTGSYEIFIIEEAGFKQRLTFGAAEMQKALDEQGNVAVYGINFDIDKDFLKPGAEKIIIEIVKLMKNNADLAIEIQGHTDNTGSAQHNMDLSQRRAEAVQKFLMIYGINPSRMPAKGYGMEKPVDSNDTQEGRAMNRRVELVKLD